MLELLNCMGTRISFLEGARSQLELSLETSNLTSTVAPYELVNTMRASVLVLGPLLARHGQAEVAMPGGCSIGARPIDQHLNALRAMGAQIQINQGVIEARSQGRLQAAHIHLDMPTVTGTENIMMAATLADGTTRLSNAAQEPEVQDLAQCLTRMGARIQGAGSNEIHIEGVHELHGCTHQVIPDRIEAATYLSAAAATMGSITLTQCTPSHLTAFTDKLTEYGAQLEFEPDSIKLSMPDQIQGIQATDITTAAYPGFPTDMQAQFLVLNAIASGRAQIHEQIFENRFRHAQEMNRMGASITLSGNTAISTGPAHMTGAQVTASDLRGAASLVIAGLHAKGQTTIANIEVIDRGYERIEEKLQQLGACITRIR